MVEEKYINNLLEKITNHYLKSNDFNGIILTDLDKDFKKVKESLKKLLKEDKISLNFGTTHPNIHILAVEPEPKKDQLSKLENLQLQKPIYENYGPLKIHKNPINCCAYPSKIYLKSAINKELYQKEPYKLLLASGEPQLSYKSFNLRILEFYRNDPRYIYETDDVSGHISIHKERTLSKPDEILLESFGFSFDKNIKNRYVAVFLRYLSCLTPEHQQRWKLEEVSGNTFLHPDYARQTCGQWPEKESIFNAFCEEICIINEMSTKIKGKNLFCKLYDRYNRPKKFSFLIRSTKKEYIDFIYILDKMISDNLNKKYFKGDLELKELQKKGENYIEKDKGTIALLDEWLTKHIKFTDSEAKDEMIKTFRNIRNERSKPAHHIQDDEWDDKFFSLQREKIKEAYKSIRTLRLIFQNHPLSKSVKVPDWLYKGEIWTY